MSNYVLLKETSPNALSVAVTSRLKDGWQLHGNPFSLEEEMLSDTGNLRTRLCYCQALLLPAGFRESHSASPERVLLKD